MQWTNLIDENRIDKTHIADAPYSLPILLIVRNTIKSIQD